MKDNLSRVMLCLAALDLTEDELRWLVTKLRSMPWQEIRAWVASLHQATQPNVVDEDTSRSSPKKSLAQFHDASVGERVERLLKVEAGLTNAQAVEKLSSQLADLGLIERQDIPPLSRRSLRAWVGQVARRVSAKDILRCATIVRNEYVHSPISDWTLRRSKQ